MNQRNEYWQEPLRGSGAQPDRNNERLAVGVRRFTLGGIEEINLGCNASAVERTQHALFALANSVRISPHSARLFQRVCSTVEKHFANPTIGPAEIAAEVGISLRYLQKLFTCRGTTCGQYIQSRRLGHALALLAGGTGVEGGQSISEIAWASGYRDRSSFHRAFRQRFGRSPGACRRQNAAICHEGSSPREDSAPAYPSINSTSTAEAGNPRGRDAPSTATCCPRSAPGRQRANGY